MASIESAPSVETYISPGGTYLGVNLNLKLDHESTQSYCQNNFGTNLATVLTESDQRDIQDLLQEFPTESTFINIGWRDYDGLKIWYPCTPLTCNTNALECSSHPQVDAPWHSKANEGYHNNQCGVIRNTNDDDLGTWTSRPCSTKRDFICNYPDPASKYGQHQPFSCIPSAIVIDISTELIRAGFSGDHAPRVQFPPLVGTPHNTGTHTGITMGNTASTYIGDDAWQNRHFLTLTYPVVQSQIVDMDTFALLLFYMYEELGIAPAETYRYPVLLTVSPFESVSNTLRHLMLDTFNVAAVYIANRASLALSVTNKQTGIVCLMDDDVTYIVAIVDASPCALATKQWDIGGQKIDEYMMNALDITDRRIAQQITRTLGYVVEDVAEEEANYDATTDDNGYTLPDGQMITVGEEQFKGPEVWFGGMGQNIFDAIQSVPNDRRSQMYENVVFTGRNAYLNGMDSRVKHDIQTLAPESVGIFGDNAAAERGYLPWLGGSRLCSLSSFEQMWLTKQDYDEYDAVMEKRSFIDIDSLGLDMGVNKENYDLNHEGYYLSVFVAVLCIVSAAISCCNRFVFSRNKRKTIEAYDNYVFVQSGEENHECKCSK
eukprot:528207_1